MTRGKLHIHPELRIIRRDKKSNESILVSSTLAKGKQGKNGIRIESKWNLRLKQRTITLVSGFLITRFGKEPLMPSEIPDRHLRSLRELGTKLFKIKPFRGLRLYIPPIQNKLILAERNMILSKEENKVSDTELKIFTHKQDAELWKLQRHTKEFTMKIDSPQAVKRELKSKMSIPKIIRSAQENSYSIRNEYVQLIEQMITGLAATKRFLVLNERGLDQELLDHVWENVFGSESPLNLDSVMMKIEGLLDTRF